MFRILLGLGFYALAALIIVSQYQHRLSVKQLRQDPVLAAALGDQSAQLALAGEWLEKAPAIAQYWLTRASEQGGADIRWRLARLALQNGDVSTFYQTLENSEPTTLTPQAATLLQDILTLRRGYQASACQQHLLFVAQDIEGISQAAGLLSAWQQDADLRSLPVCFSGLSLQPANGLACATSPRLHCDENFLANQLIDREFTHVVVMGQAGKANVHQGIMYLDRGDDFAVFVHELAHFAGLLDEYALSRELAEQFCIDGAHQANLVISQTGIIPPLPADWPQDTILSPAQTCELAEQNLQAWKPHARFSFMQFYDEGDRAPVYMQIWRAQLLESALQRPAYVNFINSTEGEIQQLWQRRLDDFQHATSD